MRNFSDIKLGSIELFCLTAQCESFTEAARKAGLSAAAVSRAVSRLETRLDIRLFHRTTRVVRLTEGGQRYYQQCQQALGQLMEAEHELSGKQQHPSGRVRISMPTSIGHCRVLPVLAAFMQRYPDINLDMDLSNRNVDFIDEGFDLVIRGRTPPDTRMVARKLIDAKLVVVATPAYLQAHGRPRNTDDLTHHSCIQFILPSSGQPVPWLFMDKNGKPKEILTAGKLHCSGDIMAMLTLARLGVGLVQVFHILVQEELKNGTLVEVLATHAGASRPFSLLYPVKKHIPLRVRVLIDFLVEAFAKPKSLRAR